ncbi:MAG TPA: hypothetical protein VNY52_02405 [Solirubrobacteraceae bacterium]|nr:hypothetical protein [Solirubrobacteraceae bacterium]
MHSLKSIYRSALKANRRQATWWLTALMGALALSLATPALGEAETSPPAASNPNPTGESNPNNYACAGHISAGKKEPVGEETPVQYTFLCNGQITGYQLQTQLPITGIEGAPLLTSFAGAPLSDSFSCSGTFPGYAVNCVGSSTTEAQERISGQFEIGWKLCTEPRVDPLLTVTYAYLEKGVITQAISGPFDLGRPLGCPATALSGKNRLDAHRGPEPTNKHKHGKKGSKSKKKAADGGHTGRRAG